VPRTKTTVDPERARLAAEGQFVREEFLRMYGPDGEAYRKDAS
jgi:hypothetical protein